MDDVEVPILNGCSRDAVAPGSATGLLRHHLHETVVQRAVLNRGGRAEKPPGREQLNISIPRYRVVPAAERLYHHA